MKKIKAGLKKLFLSMIPRKLKDYFKDLYGFDTQYCLRRLKEKNGFIPEQIIDAGAYVGDWTKMVKEIFPEAKVLMLEAQPGKEECLKIIKSKFPSTVDYKICLLGAEKKEGVPFFSLETGSSVLKENTGLPYKVLSLPMITLDEAAKEFIGEKVTLIKLDLQGYELEVLKSACEILKTAEVVLMEVSFLPFNQDGALFHQAVKFMDDQGFLVYDIGSQSRLHKDSTLVQADVFFVKKDSLLRKIDFKQIPKVQNKDE